MSRDDSRTVSGTRSPEIAAPSSECVEIPEFDLPGLRALRLHFPYDGGALDAEETIDRIHAEAEVARTEALRLHVRAAAIRGRTAAAAQAPPEDPFEVERRARELDAHSQRLFQEGARRMREERIAEVRSPTESMRDWLHRSAQIDSAVKVDIDLQRQIWMSFFHTLSEHADLSTIRRVLGVGVGFDGPERHYTEHFPAHYGLDLVDYSAHHPELRFVTGDIEKQVDLPAASFDLIYSHSVFEHLRDVERAMAEVDRLLRLGGYVYITISPLYFSPAGSHVNVPRQLARWEHLDPSSDYYMLETPDPSRLREGVFLNRLTVSAFLAAVGRVGWEIRHFGVRIVHPRRVPKALLERFSLVDLVSEELRFVGRRVIPGTRDEIS
jgi:SAM-dependent methyltransferase